MAILKATKTTPISPGQWICGDSLIRDGICKSPRKVTRVSGQRVYFLDRHGEEECYCSRHTIQFVCDTKEEGDRMHAISEAQRRALDAVRDQHAAMVAEICSASA